MRILYLSTALVPSRTANSVNILKSCEALAALGHDVALVVPRARAADLEPGVADVFAYYGIRPSFRIVRLPSPRLPGGRSLYSWLAAGYGVGFRPDLVFGRYLRASYYLCRLGFATVVELHSPATGKGAAKLRRLRALARLPGLRRVLTLTQALRQHLIDLGIPGLGAERIRAVPSGAADVPTDLTPVPLERATLGLNVGYAGGLEPHKGLGLTEGLVARVPEHDFHLMGGSPERVQFWRARLAHRNAHFYGHIAQGQLPGYIAALDVCLLPNQANPANPGGEPFTSPLKLFNYMAQGKAILASDYPEIREVLNQENSVLLDPTDPDAWARALRGLTAADRTRLGQAARRDFLRHYTLEARYSRILADL